MKKIISVLILLSLLLCGCTGNTTETTAPTTEVPTSETPTGAPTEAPATVPTEAPTEPPVFTNPLTGEALEAPHQSRTFAFTINNVRGGLPMYGVSKVDILFEMFINDYATRCLALFSDISDVKSIGSIRSLRYNFTDLCEIYDAVVVYASGSKSVLNDLSKTDVANINVGYGGGDYFYRDQARLDAGFAWEHCLYVKGPETLAFAESRDIRVTCDADAAYGLTFTEDATPAAGEDAAVITINLIHDGIAKTSIMKYDPESGKYHFWQYGSAMHDGAYQEPILFENVIVMVCDVRNQDIYHVADLVDSGEGWFACNGKIIPIRWYRENEADPITFTLADGTPLDLGVGSSYIALAPTKSTVEWE